MKKGPHAAGPLTIRLVGATRFELATPCTPCRCATRLRYAPTELEIIAGIGSSSRRLGPGLRRDDARATTRSALQHLQDAFQLLADVAGRDGLRDRHGLGAAVAAMGFQARGDGVFQPVAGAVDGEAVLVEQLADAPDQQHLVVLVVAAIAATLQGLQLSEFLLP